MKQLLRSKPVPALTARCCWFRHSLWLLRAQPLGHTPPKGAHRAYQEKAPGPVINDSDGARNVLRLKRWVVLQTHPTIFLIPMLRTSVPCIPASVVVTVDPASSRKSLGQMPDCHEVRSYGPSQDKWHGSIADSSGS